jgi:putative sigma-54 modulation protein
MNTQIKASNMELTEAIKEYVEKRLGTLDKFIRGQEGNSQMDVEVGKTTNHHKNGDVYKAEISLDANGKHFYAISEKEDLYSAVDDVKSEIERQLIETKDRDDTLFRRGARSVKKMLKGISSRNPFTSK